MPRRELNRICSGAQRATDCLLNSVRAKLSRVPRILRDKMKQRPACDSVARPLRLFAPRPRGATPADLSDFVKHKAGVDFRPTYDCYFSCQSVRRKSWRESTLIKYPVIRSGAAPAFSIPDFKMRPVPLVLNCRFPEIYARGPIRVEIAPRLLRPAVIRTIDQRANNTFGHG